MSNTADKKTNGKKNTGLKEYKILNEHSSFSVREAYAGIRTNLLFSERSEKCAIFAVCGASENAGKSLSCVNIAISFAKIGKNVLIIDSDMRHPSINKALRIKKNTGLSDVLAKLTKDIPIISTDIKNLCILPAGSIPPNPAELLYSNRFDKVLEACSERFDYIFIDTPPLNLVSDAAMLAEKVDGYIFIVRAGSDTTNGIRFAVETVTNVNGKIAGFVLNDVNEKTAGYKSGYGGYGGYGYGRYGYGRGRYGYGRYGKYGSYGKYGKYGSSYVNKYDSVEFADKKFTEADEKKETAVKEKKEPEKEPEKES